MKNLTKVKFIDYLIVTVFVISIILRIGTFNQEGGDHRTFKQAVTEFRKGINPYEYTVLSYQKDSLKHGYAYMPTLLYIQTFLVNVNHLLNLDMPTIYLWKVPVLLADIGVGLLLYKVLKEKNYSKLIILIGILFWFFNPYFIIRYEYTNYETLPVFLVLASIIYLGKKDFLSGILFALAVSLKTFPVILISVFLLKTKNLKLFFLAGVVVAILISLPFVVPPNDVTTYINGAILVHGDRGIQGRPLISFLTFYLQEYGITFYQSEFSKVYAYSAILLPQILSLYLYFKKKIVNIWVLILFSFTTYYLLTPVLNRTHLIWGIPFIFIGLLSVYKNNLKNFYMSIVLYFVLSSVYYLLWTKGLKDPTTFGGKVWIDPVFENRPKIGLTNYLYVKAIMFKRLLFSGST